MPNNTRGWARRKLEMVAGLCGNQLAHLEDILLVYEKPHPQIAEAIHLLGEVIAEIPDMAEKVKELI